MSRSTADERRRELIGVAVAAFARGGLAGTSVASIAKRVGVSQPYVFRLFPTKKSLFLAAWEECCDRIEATFETAATGRSGDAALAAVGAAYGELLADRDLLRLQLQTWALACDDEEVRETGRRRFDRILALLSRLSGADESKVVELISVGVLLNVAAALDMPLSTDCWATTAAQRLQDFTT